MHSTEGGLVTVTATPAAATHPSWCDHADCTVSDPARRGTHGSRPGVLEPDRFDAVRASVRLVQDMPVRDYPDSDPVLVELRLDFVTYEPDAEEEPGVAVLRGERARARGRLLATAGRNGAK